jgi:uncharacterized protein with HEPN domain
LPRRNWRQRIEDILDAIDRVQRYTAGQDLPAFLADQKMHAHFDVTTETLWKTAREDLPGLIDPLRRLLASP